MSLVSKDFRIPPRMESVEVAKTFSAYFQGARTFENPVSGDGSFIHGPYKMTGDENGWQLDDSNDFWLFIRGEKQDRAFLSCRYDRDLPQVQAAVTLFELRMAHRFVAA